MKNLVGGKIASGTEACNCNSSDDCSTGQSCGADCTAGNTGKAGHCIAKATTLS